MSNEKNPREELYNRFKLSLSRPVTERFFDEDELVEIYDYAGDVSDDYVQLEALFCGARLYPESAPLSERRALLYLDTSIDDSDTPSPAAGEYLNDNADMLSPIFDIARLEVNRPAEPVAAMEFLLGQYDTFSDEEIIRFLDLAADLDCYDWVLANLERIRTKISFQPVLAYEMLHQADERLDNTTMAKFAEELIEHEPFSVNYWIMLFKAQARGGMEEESRSTFDYARALGADDSDALLMLAEVAYNFAPYLYNETYDILEGLKNENPDEFMYVDCQAAMLARSDAGRRAVALLRAFVDSHTSHDRALRQLLSCNIPDAATYIERFYCDTDGVGFDDDSYMEITSSLSMSGAWHSLAALVAFKAAQGPVDAVDICSWVEALFALGRYTDIVEIFDRYSREEGGESYIDVVYKTPLKGMAVSFAYITSLMKTGRQADAEAYIAKVTPFLETVINDALMPVRMAARCILTLADKVRRHPASDKLYWEYFDMLNYSKF